VKAVGDGILRFVRLRNYPIVDMLYFSRVTRPFPISATVVNMDVSPHRRTNEIAHHGCSLVVGGEFVATQFKTRIIRTIDGPAGLGHGTMAGFVFLLGMTLKSEK